MQRRVAVSSRVNRRARPFEPFYARRPRMESKSEIDVAQPRRLSRKTRGANRDDRPARAAVQSSQQPDRGSHVEGAGRALVRAVRRAHQARPLQRSAQPLSCGWSRLYEPEQFAVFAQLGEPGVEERQMAFGGDLFDRLFPPYPPRSPARPFGRRSSWSSR